MTSEFALTTPDRAAAAIGSKLKQHRVVKNITQLDMAKRSSVSESTLKRIEAGGRGSLRDIMAVAIELGIDHEILAAIPHPPLRSLADLDADGRRIHRRRVRASKA